MADIAPSLDSSGLDIRVVEGQGYDVMQVCDAIITVSGTVTLEIALMGVPMVIIYRVSPLTYEVGKRLIKVDHIGICNIVAGERVVRELIQDDAEPRRIAAEIGRILTDSAMRLPSGTSLPAVREKLGSGGGSARVAELALAMLAQERTDNMNTFKRLLQYSRPYWWRITIAALASLPSAAWTAYSPICRAVSSSSSLSRRTGNFSATCRWPSSSSSSSAASAAMSTITSSGRPANWPFRTSATSCTAETSGSVSGFSTGTRSGLSCHGLLNDVSMMQEGMANVITGLFRDGFGALFLLGVIFYLNWKLAIIAFFVLPATVYPAQKIGRRIKNAARESQGRMGNLTSILQESYAGIKVLKAFGLEEREVGKFTAANREFYRYVRKGIKYEGISVPDYGAPDLIRRCRRLLGRTLHGSQRNAEAGGSFLLRRRHDIAL